MFSYSVNNVYRIVGNQNLYIRYNRTSYHIYMFEMELPITDWNIVNRLVIKYMGLVPSTFVPGTKGPIKSVSPKPAMTITGYQEHIDAFELEFWNALKKNRKKRNIVYCHYNFYILYKM